MNISEHDPIAIWMKAAQERMPIADMEHLVMAEIRAIAEKRTRQRRHLAFGWGSFLIGALSGLWLASPFFGTLTSPEIGALAQIAVSLALVFGFDALWRQTREFRVFRS